MNNPLPPLPKNLADALKLKPFEFEKFVALLFRAQGYEIEVTPATNDGGVDIFVYKGDYKIIVECKQYSAKHLVGLAIIQRLYGVMVAKKANRACIVTTSGFTKAATGFAHEQNIMLVDKIMLSDWIRYYHELKEFNLRKNIHLKQRVL